MGERGGGVVGVMHANGVPGAPQEECRAGRWGVTVDADGQGAGVGSLAVGALGQEAGGRGVDRLTVLWGRGEEGPEGFFLRQGFTPVGETPYGEVIGAIEVSRPSH